MSMIMNLMISIMKRSILFFVCLMGMTFAFAQKEE